MRFKELIGERVNVHFNLHNKLWSVKYKGKVIDTSGIKYLAIEPIRFHVNEKARLKVIKKECRSVHAWVVGTLISVDILLKHEKVGISYNPYYAGFFYYRESLDEVKNPKGNLFFNGETKFIHEF